MADSVTLRLVPALGLLLLAPVTAEYLYGYDDSTGNLPALLEGMFIFVPLYGCAALLIREVARRAGLGWPGIFLLALAFGVLQPGLIDQAMFNPSYRDIDYLQPMREATLVPELGISGYLTLTWTVGHMIWSMSVPIAVVETFVPGRGSTPWLRLPGLIVTGLLFSAAAVFVVRWHLETERFLASPGQMAGTAAVVVALIVAAFVIGRRRRPGVDLSAPNPWLAGAVTLVLLSPDSSLLEYVAMAFGADLGFLVDWRGVAVNVACLGVLATLLARWSRREGWGAPHRLAVAGGALLIPAVTGFAVEPIGEVSTAAKLTHNTVVAVGVVVLLAIAAARLRRGPGHLRNAAANGPNH